jgi:hypothetical protein
MFGGVPDITTPGLTDKQRAGEPGACSEGKHCERGTKIAGRAHVEHPAHERLQYAGCKETADVRHARRHARISRGIDFFRARPRSRRARPAAPLTSNSRVSSPASTRVRRDEKRIARTPTRRARTRSTAGAAKSRSLLIRCARAGGRSGWCDWRRHAQLRLLSGISRRCHRGSWEATAPCPATRT